MDPWKRPSIRTQRFMLMLLGILTALAVVAVLKVAQSVVLPLIIAFMLSFILNPLFKWLERLGINRLFAGVIIFVFLSGVFYAIGVVLFSSINQLVRQFPAFQQKFTTFVDQILTSVNARVDLPEDFFAGYDWSATLRSGLGSVSGGFVDFVQNLVVVLLFLFFIVLERPFFKFKLDRAFNPQASKDIESVFDHVVQQIGHYLTVKALISAVTGFLFWVTCEVVGLEFAFLWGILAFLLNFIPSIGSIIITFVVTMFAFVQFYPSWGLVLATFLVTATIEMILGNVVDPRLMGHRLDLSPLLILVGLIFFGWLWGITGMFISIPLLVVIKIIFGNIPQFRAIAVLMDHGKRAYDAAKKKEQEKAAEGEES